MTMATKSGFHRDAKGAENSGESGQSVKRAVAREVERGRSEALNIRFCQIDLLPLSSLHTSSFKRPRLRPGTSAVIPRGLWQFRAIRHRLALFGITARSTS